MTPPTRDLMEDFRLVRRLAVELGGWWEIETAFQRFEPAVVRRERWVIWTDGADEITAARCLNARDADAFAASLAAALLGAPRCRRWH